MDKTLLHSNEFALQKKMLSLVNNIWLMEIGDLPISTLDMQPICSTEINNDERALAHIIKRYEERRSSYLKPLEGKKWS